MGDDTVGWMNSKTSSHLSTLGPPAALWYEHSCPEDQKPKKLAPHSKGTSLRGHGPPVIPSPKISTTLSTSQSRILAQSNFSDLFFPQSSAGGAIFDSISADSPAFLAAGDALCALQIGAVHHDTVLLREFSRLYGKALHCLRIAIQKVGKDTPSNDLSATVYFLAIIELCISGSFDAPGWMQHAQVLLRFYNKNEARGSTPGPASRCYLKWQYTFSLGFGLLQKQCIHYEPPLWNNELRRRKFPLLELSMRVPACLKRLEAVRLVHNAPPNSVIDTVSEALELRANMQDTILDWSFNLDLPPYRVVGLGDYPAFKGMLEDLASVYSTAYTFTNLTTAQLHRTLWTCHLVLDQAVVDVRGPYWAALASLNQRELDKLESELPVFAGHLCRSLPYFNLPELCTAGSISTLEPLYFLERHFERHGSSKQLAWTRKVSDETILGRKIVRILAASEGKG
ncbi:hypothetical protein BAUCODRAFT_483003 [Baudoinia panamericana UAMH 10762]|uniref:Transcription factor domain-containing protein n=1 Tax=Baudoinia panamericana (strain UAMH 10762) TaxID=717646 RepID=M2LQC0_BAUPA|nr:uncharacterized protein BAUCODRAFT_483003 [Baudoinia panamericana UAMH 10762]EMC96612.1 hypothetical protein BAUCODRAFT_483003 [Baudoinia panamericana UAMH 10762]